MVGDVAGPVLADHAQGDNPIQKLAADIASLPHPLGRRFLDQLVEARLLDPAVNVLRPCEVGHAVALAGVDLRSADLEGEAAGAENRHPERPWEALGCAASGLP